MFFLDTVYSQYTFAYLRGKGVNSKIPQLPEMEGRLVHAVIHAVNESHYHKSTSEFGHICESLDRTLGGCDS